MSLFGSAYSFQLVASVNNRRKLFQQFTGIPCGNLVIDLLMCYSLAPLVLNSLLDLVNKV